MTLSRSYDRLEVLPGELSGETVELPCPGEVLLPGVRVVCGPAQRIVNTADTFTVRPVGTMLLRPRRAGDALRLSGGTKSLKKRFIDRKIPASERQRIPVLCDEQGILGVYQFGADLDRAAAELPAVTVHFEKTKNKGE